MKLTRIKCFLLILLICFPANILAAGSNSISIRLKNLGTTMYGIRFEIYKIGSIKEDSPVIDEKFHIKTLPQEAYQLDNTAKNISNKLSGEADKSSTTDKNGVLVFDGLEDGVYLIRMSDSDSYGNISPFLVWLPYYENKKKLHAIEIEPKASVPDITDTDSIKQTPTSAPSIVKTGDYSNYLLYAALLVFSATACLTAAKKKWR